jgi:processive 1,2-diacylglycerol beta-glucosyltransferase
MTKLLILSSDTGEGHNSVAAAIENAAESAGFHPVTRKPMGESLATVRAMGNLYNALLKHRPQWMRWYFGLIERVRPNERDIFYPQVRDFIGRFIAEESPDILLSVHPMLNHFIQRYIKDQRLPIPCYTFLTDPFPPFWRGWASPFVDRYFVPTQESLKALIAAGVTSGRIERVAMPMREGFRPATMTEIQQFRTAHTLDGSSTILINGGARGGGPIGRIYKTVRENAPGSNILIVCGWNQKLRRQMEQTQDSRTRTFGFVENLHRYVAASDLVITKPGAVSTYEALACGVPVVLAGIRGLMPQESGFFHAARQYDFGFAAETFSELAQAIQAGPSVWNKKRDSVARFYKHNSGNELIERMHPADVRA